MGVFFSKICGMKENIKLNKPIVMVGLMGAGKTSVGRALARRLGIPFVDSDKEIEAAAGCSVVDIFAMYGEAEFRRAEQRVIERLFDTPPALKVISTTLWMQFQLLNLVKSSFTIKLWLEMTREKELKQRQEESYLTKHSANQFFINK